MSAASEPSFSELLPELFVVIVEHIPLIYRPPTLRSLALTCHRIHDVVFPELVYDAVRLVGEDQALTMLEMLIAKADEQGIQKQGNPSLSHCIHHICLDSSIKTPICGPNSLDALKKLIDVNGLQHLSSLTLQVVGKWDGTEGDDLTGHILKLPPSFFTSLETKCPNLNKIQLSDFSQEFRKEWMEPHVFSSGGLNSIRIQSRLLNYPSPTINLSQLPPNLHTLELRLDDYIRGKKIDFSDILGGCVIPNLRSLILDQIVVSNPLTTNSFWRAHPAIERLELGRKVAGNWFADMDTGIFPNLKYLQCSADHALVLLPWMSNSLINLCLWETYNAQCPYLLRVVSQGGILPALRSLAIHRESGNSPKPREGHKWREDENGDMSEADARKAARHFDGNYIMSLANAAPNLEELELMGTSDDTLDSLTASLSRFSKLQRLTLSGGINCYNKPFFACSQNWDEYLDFDVGGVEEKDYGKYAPETFDEAARDLANGCRTLNVVTIGNVLGELSIRDGLSRRVVRDCEGGPVKQLVKTRALGNIIGREEDW